jgi:hypothetical protein
MNIIHTTSGNNLSALSIDYNKYGAGEAALAWLDTSVIIHSKHQAIVKGYEFINDMAGEISLQKFPIGHLKFFLESGEWQTKVSYTSHNPTLVTTHVGMIADHVHVLVNARVETDPDQLKKIFYRAIQKIQDQNCHAEIIEVAAFQPGYPNPTHRLSD